MAFKKYNQTFAFQLFFIIILAQLVVAGGMYGWQLYAVDTVKNGGVFLQIIVPLLILEIVSAGIVVMVARRPLKKIDDAIAYANNHAGLKEDSLGDLAGIIKSIRRLDAHLSLNEAVTTDHEFAQSLLDHLPIGVVALDQNRQITYANKAAPLHGGGKELNLHFKERESLDDWLNMVAEKNISGHKWWRRLTQSAVENEEKSAIRF